MAITIETGKSQNDLRDRGLGVRLLPISTTLFATLLTLVPVRLPGAEALTPAFALMTIYHWTIYRPNLLSSSGLFGIGIAYDLLAGGLPGVSSLLFLISRTAVLRFRSKVIDQTFLKVWAGFALLVIVAMLGSWLLHSTLEFRLLALDIDVFRGALTIVLFPFVSFILGRAQHAVIGSG